MSEALKEAGVNIHVVSTGAGVRIQQALWNVPGSSAYLSGTTFPYAQEEQEELLGFMPEHFCSEEAAIDLASAAFMKAYRFGGKKPVGVGVTASVASSTMHRGDHRFFVCIMTDDKVKVTHKILRKGVGAEQRVIDDMIVTDEVMQQLEFVLSHSDRMEDASEKAHAQFMRRPFFTADGRRHATLQSGKFALMSGAYNPPHVGHFGVADHFQEEYGKRVAFEVTAVSPHKAPLTVQDLLKRAKLLHGRDRFFSTNIPFFIDKARAFPGMPFIMGADAMLRILDPKWGLDVEANLKEFEKLGTKFYVNGRVVDGTFLNAYDIVKQLPDNLFRYGHLFKALEGRWDISSTELRNQLK